MVMSISTVTGRMVRIIMTKILTILMNRSVVNLRMNSGEMMTSSMVEMRLIMHTDSLCLLVMVPT